jgi:LPS export ABC transporter protein LptC
LRSLNRTGYLQYFLLCFCVLLTSCSNDPKEVETFVSSENLPLETMKQAELIYTENGILKAKIIANKIERFLKPTPVIDFSEGILVYFYNDSAIVASTLTAQEAVINNNSQKMIARTNVELINSKNQKLNTEELIWDERSNLIYTQELVQITSEKEVIFGEGFESTPDFSSYKITNVRGNINIQEKNDTLN